MVKIVPTGNMLEFSDIKFNCRPDFGGVSVSALIDNYFIEVLYESDFECFDRVISRWKADESKKNCGVYFDVMEIHDLKIFFAIYGFEELGLSEDVREFKLNNYAFTAIFGLGMLLTEDFPELLALDGFKEIVKTKDQVGRQAAKAYLEMGYA